MADKPTNIKPATAPTAVSMAPPVAAPAAQDVPAHCVPCPPQLFTDRPLRWKSANVLEQRMLENLQGNILKGHGRDATTNLFFTFGTDVQKSKRALRELGNFHVTSAYKQLLATDAFKSAGTDGGTFCSVFISAHGYRELELAFAAPERNTAFGEGMRQPSQDNELGDDPDNWDANFPQNVDGMVLIADDDPVRGWLAVNKVQQLLAANGCTVVYVQAGTAIRSVVGNGLEHFGYVDGRSQPLLLLEDIESESRDEGIVQWDPAFGLDRALVPDPLAPADALAFGSFFIFRKLEQHVRAFKTREQDLADTLGLTGDERERAGALLVGRFEDGTPVTMSSDAKGLKAPHNDFNYDADGAGSRCPFHAHIRKTNPRGSGQFEPPADERLHIMVRRGITYEDVKRAVHPDALPEAGDKAEFLTKVAPLLPDKDVGLLFMAYNAQLDDQFVFTQRNWANFAGFPKVPFPAPAGLDGLIGQPRTPGDAHRYQKDWDDPTSPAVHDTGFNGFVTMRAGEYFFAPSLHFLRNL